MHDTKMQETINTKKILFKTRNFFFSFFAETSIFLNRTPDVVKLLQLFQLALINRRFLQVDLQQGNSAR